MREDCKLGPTLVMFSDLNRQWSHSRFLF